MLLQDIKQKKPPEKKAINYTILNIKQQLEMFHSIVISLIQFNQPVYDSGFNLYVGINSTEREEEEI